MNISIRREQEKDYRRVEEITREAFAYQERIQRGQIGCPYEHWMVNELRKRDGIPELSLVAEVDNRMVGHVICSKAQVRTSEKVIPVLNFGPISVLPEYQRKGVGKALIENMISSAKQLGYGAILFFGRPEYYPRFGFKEASAWEITDNEGYNYPAFMGMELIPNYLSGAKGGKYYESDIYNDELNRDKVKAFDKYFETNRILAIKQEENEFPKLFASYVEKEYGILFYMEDNKDSYDGNHACIYPEKISDLGAVLDDIAAFYREKGMRASIYHPFVKNYFKENEEILNAHGYTYTPEEDHRVMLLTAENQINVTKRLDIQVLKCWDERVAADILIPSGEPWEVDVTKKRMEQGGSYLFVGYLDGKAVVYTDIHKSEHGNTRFDYIVTATEYRGKGYASELLSYVVEYCKKQEFPTCWQWAGPSEHICYQAGFREAFPMEAGFATGPELDV